MNIAVLTVAFYSEKFSKIFISSFRKYYPKVALVVVNNNYETYEDKDINEIGQRETRFLKSVVDNELVYLENKGSNRSHGIGLDVGVKYLYEKGFDIVVTVDIDSMFLRAGMIKETVEACVKGFTNGGVVWRINRDVNIAYGPGGFIHPSLAFYTVLLLLTHKLSFEDEAGKHSLSTGKRISDTFGKLGYRKTIDIYRKCTYHFCSGSAVRSTGKKLVWNKVLSTGKYKDSLHKFFGREDVKEYLR